MEMGKITKVERGEGAVFGLTASRISRSTNKSEAIVRVR